MSTHQRSTSRHETAKLINVACRYILSLPNYRSVQPPKSSLQILTLADSTGYLPLHFAVASHNAHLFNLLVEIFFTFPDSMTYFNTPDNLGNTPLHWAIMVTNYQAAETLVQYGADVTRINGSGKTPLHLLVASCFDIRSQTDLTAHRQMAKFFISVGAKVDCFDINNITPLHIAAETGDAALVGILIHDGGAFINVTDEVGETPLFYALRGSSNSHKEVVQKLVNCNANLFAKNEEGETPLEFCRATQAYSMIELLNQYTDISTCYQSVSPSSRMNISGMSISDSMSLSQSSEISSDMSMDVCCDDLSRSQELKKPAADFAGEATRNFGALSLF